MKKKHTSIGIFVILTFMLIILTTGCYSYEYAPIEYNANTHMTGGVQIDYSKPEYISAEYVGAEDEDTLLNADEYEYDCNRGRFLDSSGNYAVHIISEDIVAIFSNEFETSFELIAWYNDVRYTGISESDSTRYWPDGFEFNWADYSQRLSVAQYSLKIHYSLEMDVNRIIKWNLMSDNVVPGDFEFTHDIAPYNFLNEDVFDRFVSENVTIELIGGEGSSKEDYSRQFEWLVYAGGCRFLNEVCTEHTYLIWLVDFSSVDRVVWDIRTVSNPGCGCTCFFSYR